MRKQLLLLSLLIATFLTACGPSPESAAQEVCYCIGKFKSSSSFGEMTGNMAECSQLQQKYAQEFKGEDLNTFVKQTTECTVGGLFK